MTLQTSGTITASDINTELSKTSTSALKLSDTDARALAGKSSGIIKYSDFYGKSSSVTLGSYGPGSLAFQYATNPSYPNPSLEWYGFGRNISGPYYNVNVASQFSANFGNFASGTFYPSTRTPGYFPQLDFIATGVELKAFAVFKTTSLSYGFGYVYLSLVTHNTGANSNIAIPNSGWSNVTIAPSSGDTSGNITSRTLARPTSSAFTSQGNFTYAPTNSYYRDYWWWDSNNTIWNEWKTALGSANSYSIQFDFT